MSYWRTALLSVLAAGAALAAQAAPATDAADTVKVEIRLSCLPNPTTRALSDCKVMSVTPPEFAPLVGPNAVARANASKMPADWQTSLAKDGLRVIVPASVQAQPRTVSTVTSPAGSETDILVTLSCIPNPDLSVRACQVLSTKPEASGAAAAALSAVTQGKLDPNWRNVYKVENGRVILPVHMKKPGQ